MSKRPVKRTSVGAMYSTRELLRDLFVLISPYRRELTFATFGRLAGDLAGLFPSIALAAIVTFISAWRPGESVAPVSWWLAAWFVTAVTRQGTIFYAKTRTFAAAERAALDVREQGMEKLLHLDIAWHERENAGNKLKRIENGANGVQRLVRIWIGSVIEIVVTLIGALVILATVDPFVSIASLVFLAAYGPMQWWLRRDAGVIARAVNVEDEKMSGAMFESINNVRTAKVLDMSSSLMTIIRRHAEAVYAKTLKRIMLYQTIPLITGTLTALFQVGAIAYIIYGVAQGRLEVGFLLLFHGYFSRLTNAVTELSGVSQDAAVAKHSIGRMMEVFRAPAVDSGSRDFPHDWSTLSLRNVGYSYGGRKVLRGVSFDIRRGERVGVVGLSGSGKSTLFKLLLKELEDYSGEILFDGVPLREIRKDSLYRHAAVVLQETEVFNFSLRQNVAIAVRGRKSDPAALKRALDTAHVTDFLGRIPGGVDAVIGEKGVRLSGGERQRVGIARAVFKRPDILFLDEATSHLDLESEERIRDSLHVFFKNVTAVVIAHRLTTIKEMDRIVVLEAGRLIEQGSFEELHSAKGRFHELWEKQKLG